MDYSYIINDYRLNVYKLLEYGFIKKDDGYLYKVNLQQDDFYALIFVKENMMHVKVYDQAFDEEYIPFTLKRVTGSFVSSLKEEVEIIIEDIVRCCYEYDSMKEKILTYVQQKYQTVLECPFQKSLNIAMKTKHKQKWYGLMMTIPYTSLGIEKEGKVDVLNIKNTPQKIECLIDHQRYFPAYHMNKKYWMSVIIDQSLNEEDIFQLIDESYQLVEK